MLPSDNLSCLSLHEKKSRGFFVDRPSHANGALLIFAKAPVSGQVKTRLCPPLSPDEAASLHGSMVMDTVERSRDLPDLDVSLACTPSMDHPFFKTLAARYNIRLFNQVGANLGQRMDQAITSSLNQRYPFTLLVGTDIPNLSGYIYKQAKEVLQSHDVVFGPTPDGGYYLIGLKKPAPELFTNIQWSSDSVLSQSETKAKKLGLSVGVISPEQDIDTIDDLISFMKTMRKSPKMKLSTRTSNVLQTLAQRHIPENYK